MDNKHPINALVDTTMEKIRAMADVNTLIGQPIVVGDVTLVVALLTVLVILSFPATSTAFIFNLYVLTGGRKKR